MPAQAAGDRKRRDPEQALQLSLRTGDLGAALQLTLQEARDLRKPCRRRGDQRRPAALPAGVPRKPCSCPCKCGRDRENLQLSLQEARNPEEVLQLSLQEARSPEEVLQLSLQKARRPEKTCCCPCKWGRDQRKPAAVPARGEESRGSPAAVTARGEETQKGALQLSLQETRRPKREPCSSACIRR
ncbi:hypothetical protein NDU88_006937 [Pleurodeles waltl]|uniref:Uncharacterized protein n=1 Tax=Pleurodeles waltl TaxID=8319 RepID=A0AAV7SQW8_PLEWA|nr:hypothetical protein NDU88_006937 [Pleurodeles waltl]